jgi:hypothetical protein
MIACSVVATASCLRSHCSSCCNLKPPCVLVYILQIIQQHVIPDKALTEFSISNNQKLNTLLADSPLTVSLPGS